MVCGLSGVWRIHLRWPVLVDASSMTWAIGSAIAMQHRYQVLGVALSLVAGCIKETGPVFAACYAWNPLPLIGLVAPILRRLTVSVGTDIFDEQEASILAHPVRAGLSSHRGKWLDPFTMLTPWGIGIIASITSDLTILPMLLTTVALGYGQLLVATDTVRLYQWAAPPVILASMTVVPPVLALPALLIHFINPWSGDGV
jgi:hypothetical protein